MFKTIKIDNTSIYRPNDFSPNKTQVYKGEITTVTGKTIADLIGWKWDDLEMQWDALPQSQLKFIMSLSGEHTIEFEWADGKTYSEAFRPSSNVSTNTRVTYPDGTEIWKDVKFSISFIDTHR